MVEKWLLRLLKYCGRKMIIIFESQLLIGRKVCFNLFCKQEWTQQLKCLKHTFQPPTMFDCKYSISNLAFSFAKSVCSPENVFISAKWGSAVFIKHFVGRWWRSNKKMLIQFFSLYPSPKYSSKNFWWNEGQFKIVAFPAQSETRFVHRKSNRPQCYRPNWSGMFFAFRLT